MKTKRILAFLLCFVMLVATFATIALANEGESNESGSGEATPASTHYTETVNEDGSVTIEGFGTIPKDATYDYADKDAYPFALFVYKNGALNKKFAYPTMGTAINAAKVYQDDNKWDAESGTYTGTVYNTILIMRRDYTTRNSDTNTASDNMTNPGGDKFGNYAQMMGEMVLDLNGYTLTQGKNTNAIFCNITNKPWGGKVYESEYTVVNGKLVVDNNPVFYGNMWNPIYYGEDGSYITEIYQKVVKDDIETFEKISGAKLMQSDDGKYYYVDSSGARIEHVYRANGTEINQNGIYKSTIGSMIDKDFIWNFKNVDFEYKSDATTQNMLMRYGTYQGYTQANGSGITPPDTPAPFYFNFTDCTFDLTNAPASGVTLFNATPADDDNSWLKIFIDVDNCEIKAPAEKLSNFTLYSGENVFGSSINLDGGLNLTVTGNEDIPASPNAYYYVADNDTFYWSKISESENKYRLVNYTCSVNGNTCADANSDGYCDQCLTEKFGNTWVSEENNAETYPFVVLDNNGAYVGVYTTWAKAVVAVRAHEGYTIVLRRDYVIGPSSDSVNLKFGVGNFTVDLNGYSMTRKYDGAYLFDNYCDKSTVPGAVNVTVKNGTVYSEKWLICLSGKSDMACEKDINFQFENVTFKYLYTPAYNSVDGWIVSVHSMTYNQKITSNITFNGCTFDSTEMDESLLNKGAPFLNLDVNNKFGVDYVKCNLTFNGGKIITNVFGDNNFYQIHSDDTVTFGTYNEEYIKLEIPKGKSPAAHSNADLFTKNGDPAFFHTYTTTTTEATTPVCERKVYTLTNCEPNGANHTCVCGAIASDCSDSNDDKDHNCDICGKRVSACTVDNNNDHNCDVCGERSECIDANLDHSCDTCSQRVPCVDLNRDHSCDIASCTEKTSCEDVNKDHNCDICGTELSNCSDSNNDEICDVCGYVVNDYGIKDIPAEYASVDEYPFFVLKLQDGVYTFEYARSKFYGSHEKSSAMGSAIYYVLNTHNMYDKDKGYYVPQGTATEAVGTDIAVAIIVMRRDYALAYGTGSGQEYYDNIAHAQGHIIIDLGGHTFSEIGGASYSVFDPTLKGWSSSDDLVYTFPSTYTFKNGNIKVCDHAFANVRTSDFIEENAGWSMADAKMTINFENIVFGLVEGAKTSTLVYSNGKISTNAHEGHVYVNVNVKNCTFDLETNPPMPGNPITIVDNSTNETGVGSDVDCDVVFENCTLLAKDMSLITVHKTGDKYTSSTIVVNKDDLTLKMPTGTATPLATNTVVIDTGAICAFKKSSTTDGYDVYALTPAATIGFKITSNVTLDTNFIYNIYVPAANVIGITVNDEAVSYKNLMKDGVACLHVAVNLPAGSSLEDFVLKITLNTGNGTSVTAKSTLSVFKYSKTVIKGNYAASTKTLVKDMLVYASAAHTFFENTEKVSSNLSEINTLLNGYFRELPMGEAKQPADDTYFTDVAVYVGEIPSFRFYLANGYTANDFTFTVDGNPVTTKAENGYIEVVMPAYKMLSDVTYTVKNTSVEESYNLYSYYDFVRKGSDANLLAIVKGLMKYAASAKEYFNVNYGQIIFNVPEAIRPNDEGKNVTVLFTNPDYYSAVKFTTDNPNVYIENGKIYAKGTFDEETTVTVTATTDHHYATATVKVYQTYFIDNYEGNDPNTLEGGKYITDSNGNNLTTNYVVKGVIDIVDFNEEGKESSNNKTPYVQFHFRQKNRLLLWDNNSNGVLGMGYEKIKDAAGTNKHFDEDATGLEKYEYDAEDGLTLEWMLIVKDNVASIYINGEYQCSLVAYEGYTFQYLNIGANLMNVWVSITDVCTESGEPERYNSFLPAYTNGFVIPNYVNDSQNLTTTGKTIVDASKQNLTTNYVVEGMLDMANINLSNKPHVQFKLKDGYRFLLCNNDNDGIFGVGYQKNGHHTYDTELPQLEIYNVQNGKLTLKWAVVVDENSARFYIEDVLVATFDKSETGEFELLNVGAWGIDIWFYNINVCTKAENPDAYNTLIAKYN